MDANAAESMGVVLALIIAVSLALAQAVGPLLMYLTEAIKATGKVADGYSGLVTLALGIVMGAALGGLTDALAAESYGFGIMLAVGAFGGALMAANAVKTFKAVGQVNTTEAYMQGRYQAQADQSFGTNTQSVNSFADTSYPMPSEALGLLTATEPRDDGDAEPQSTWQDSAADFDPNEVMAELDAMDTYVADPDTPNVIEAEPLPEAGEAESGETGEAEPDEAESKRVLTVVRAEHAT